VTLQLAAELGVENAILDGEVIAAGETGRPQFYDLLRRARTPAYVAFDLRWLNGDDVPRRSACESAPKRDPSQNCRKELKSQEKTPDVRGPDRRRSGPHPKENLLQRFNELRPIRGGGPHRC
jgi:hypothetical protein